MPEFARPVVMVSECLGFTACRWDGSIIADETITRLRDYVDFRPVCPEVAIGLGVPRLPLRVIAGSDELKLYQPDTGIDLTPLMSAFCQGQLNNLAALDGFILKSRSPSCGTRDVKVFAVNGKSLVTNKGSGIMGRAVLANCDSLPVEDESRLRLERNREHFYTRLFTRARFRQVETKGTMRELVRFHMEQQLLLMAYNQTALRKLSRIIANPEKHKTGDVLTEYAGQLYSALAHPPRQTSVINTLMYILNEFTVKLSAPEKALFLETLAKYRAGNIPISTCLTLVQGWIKRFKNANLQRQSFIYPFPGPLVDEPSAT